MSEENTLNSNMTTEQTQQAEQGVTKVSVYLQQLAKELSKAVIGQEEVIRQVLIALISGGHVLLEGVPGLGKTLIVKSLAKTFGGEFARIQFTPDLMPADVTGHVMYNPKEGEFQTRKGPVFTNLLLADEINRAAAKTQAALLEVMQEKQVTIEGKTIPVAKPFMVLATQNPLEQEGTYPLPEAQLDRFLMKVQINHLSEADEQKLLNHVLGLQAIMDIYTDEVKTIISPEQLLKLQLLVNKVTVDERVIKYALDIVRLTREFHGIAVGVGCVAVLPCWQRHERMRSLTGVRM